MDITTTPDIWPFVEDDTCEDCGGDHDTDDHAAEAALDEDADRYFDAWDD